MASAVRDPDPAVASARSDGAFYANSRYVQPIIQGIGDWEMQSDYSASSTRNVFVDFSQPVVGSCPICPNRNPVALTS